VCVGVWGQIDNAPVTRICVIASAIFSVFLGIKGGSNKLGLSYQVALLLFFGVVFLWVFR
jgi:hypothetical protein